MVSPTDERRSGEDYHHFRFFVGLLMLPLVRALPFAQQGDAAAGKASGPEEPQATACRNCHGTTLRAASGPISPAAD